MNYFNDSESGHSDEKIGLKHIAFLIVLFLVLLLPAGWMFYSAHQEQVKQEELRKTREEWRKAIATLMQDYPRKNEVKKEKKMSVEIARGETGQADYFGWSGCEGGLRLGSSADPSWMVRRDPNTGAGNREGHVGSIFGYENPNEPNGWLLIEGGIVTVPSDAAPGTYEAVYITSCINPDDPEEPAGQEHYYVFEVPCVKIDLTATRVR